MITVTSTECRKRFHYYTRVAEAGVVVVVTRYGKPWFQLQRHKSKSPTISKSRQK
jgi:antitoxin (DNA-binding transcriptional repressor) of toxin-antitoxin stability system